MVGGIEKQRQVPLMRDLVIDHGRYCHPVVLQAVLAEWLAFELGLACTMLTTPPRAMVQLAPCYRFC